MKREFKMNEMQVEKIVEVHGGRSAYEKKHTVS